MKAIEKSVIESLDGADIELFPFIPYILQDLWEIGADPKIMLKLVRENIGKKDLNVLDLGCGKGAVSINIAKALNCPVTGIDAVPAFIESAKKYAEQHRVGHLCKFEVGDIRIKISELKGFDVIVLGAIGQVLGSLQQTLKILTGSLNAPGYILLDDSYIDDRSLISYDHCLKKTDFYGQIASAGFRIVEEIIINPTAIEESDNLIYNSIEKRIRELITQYPEKKEIFLGYLESQEYENQMLETELVCGAWLLAFTHSEVNEPDQPKLP